MTMNNLVVLFFVHTTVATFILGWKFYSQNDAVIKKFGIGLLLNGMAFAVWSAAVLLNPDDLETWTKAGAVFFVGTLYFFLVAGTNDLEAKLRGKAMGGGILLLVLLVVLRGFFYPSEPYFSEAGLFYFNIHPIPNALYIAALTFAGFPAFSAVANRMSAGYALLVKAGFTALAIGSIILLVSFDEGLLYIDGWVLGISYLVLWTSLLFGGSKPWQA